VEEFDFGHERSLEHETITHPDPAGSHYRQRRMGCSSALRGAGETHVSIGARDPWLSGAGTGSRSRRRVGIGLAKTHQAGRGLQQGTGLKLARIPPITLDEVNYIPPEAAKLFLELVSSR
jgi:hypothetical protein